MSGISVAGEEYACDAEVVRWDDPGGLGFFRRDPGTRPRLRQIDTVVVHWTGGDPPHASRVHRVLTSRRLAVEYIVDREGTVYQTCDPARLDCADCGRRWDPRSVGIEIVNYGCRRPASRRWSLLPVPKRARDRELIPAESLSKPPSAELRPDQKDQDSLPAYEELDAILQRYVEQDQSPTEIVDAGFEAETVARVVGLVDRNEYKRQQSAPGLKVTSRAFGTGRRLPIAQNYQPL